MIAGSALIFDALPGRLPVDTGSGTGNQDHAATDQYSTEDPVGTDLFAKHDNGAAMAALTDVLAMPAFRLNCAATDRQMLRTALCFKKYCLGYCT